MLVKDLRVGMRVLTDAGVMVVTQDAQATRHPVTSHGGETWFAYAVPTGFYNSGEPVGEDLLKFVGSRWTIQGNNFRNIYLAD